MSQDSRNLRRKIKVLSDEEIDSKLHMIENLLENTRRQSEARSSSPLWIVAGGTLLFSSLTWMAVYLSMSAAETLTHNAASLHTLAKVQYAAACIALFFMILVFLNLFGKQAQNTANFTSTPTLRTHYSFLLLVCLIIIGSLSLYIHAAHHPHTLTNFHCNIHQLAAPLIGAFFLIQILFEILRFQGSTRLLNPCSPLQQKVFIGSLALQGIGVLSYLAWAYHFNLFSSPSVNIGVLCAGMVIAAISYGVNSVLEAYLIIQKDDTLYMTK